MIGISSAAKLIRANLETIIIFLQLSHFIENWWSNSRPWGFSLRNPDVGAGLSINYIEQASKIPDWLRFLHVSIT